MSTRSDLGVEVTEVTGEGACSSLSTGFKAADIWTPQGADQEQQYRWNSYAQRSLGHWPGCAVKA